jgi:hypothetical protein
MRVNFKIVIIIISFFIVPKCIASKVISTKAVWCGDEWINIHMDNPNLIGVIVQQKPERIRKSKSKEIQKQYELYSFKHPFQVTFVFKNNKAHIIRYTPIGQVMIGFWEDFKIDATNKDKIITNLKIGKSCIWKCPNCA